MKESLHLGTWISAGSPAIVELAAACGLDWVLLDLEHGEFGEERVPELLRALGGSETRGIVRVPGPQADAIGRALDRGADGIMVPHVRSAAEARAVVSAMRYPPGGSRGVSRTVRAHGYGTRPFPEAGENGPLFLAQIEDLNGIENAAEIAAVEGVDGLFAGPADLRHALAQTPEAPSYEDCLARILAAASEAGKSSGILTREPETVSDLQAAGFQWIAVGSDFGFLRDAYLSVTSFDPDKTP